jgi:DNA-binding transcriptional MerR regulator
MQQESRVRSLEDAVRVGEAAAILGVTTKTLRNWDRQGKVKARRHPVNGYRLYLREELEELLNAERICQE